MILDAVQGAVGFDSMNAMIQNKISAFLKYFLDNADTLFFRAGEEATNKFKHQLSLVNAMVSI